MTLLIFTWYLLTFPTDKLVCRLWINQPPSRDALVAACGTDDLHAYRLDVMQSGKTICSVAATSLASVAQDCKLASRLDAYRLRVIEPQVVTLICSVTIEHEGQPTSDEVTAQCPSAADAWRSGQVQARLIKSQPKAADEAPAMCAAPILSVGPGLYQQASTVEDIHTDDALTWLAGRLIWFGIVRPSCGSGLDPFTLAANSCGMPAARLLVTQWQNQFDKDIFIASIQASVPANLLKRMISVESQFWPLYVGKAGEAGMMQVTGNGADVLLRYSTLEPKYPTMATEAQYWKRTETLNKFDCMNCSLNAAIDHTREIIPLYARLLAAYRCRAVEINPSLFGEEAWRQAAADYNGSAEYLKRIEQ